jgi:hypothetical protein
MNLRLLWDALFLQRDAYERLRDDNNPFVEGLFIVVIMGILLAIAGLVGSLLEWASTPSLADIQEIVLDNLQQMPWYQMMEQQGGAQALDMFQRQYDLTWQIVRSFTSPLSALSGYITQPLGLIVSWQLLVLVGHGLARLFGGSGNLGQTLGTTALAVAPQAINLLGAIPFVVAAGVGTWGLLCFYLAIRTTHGLSWPRAMWTAVLTPLILVLVAAVILGLIAALFGATLSAVLAGGR